MQRILRTNSGPPQNMCACKSMHTFVYCVRNKLRDTVNVCVSTHIYTYLYVFIYIYNYIYIIYMIYIYIRMCNTTTRHQVLLEQIVISV